MEALSIKASNRGWNMIILLKEFYKKNFLNQRLD
ncbi:hypothetical protein HPLT_03255 [Helicobacter pylori Lithuania75]|nr:hypothetical protein HPLT_03255 [Helicobacter pylori Lithuania75]